MLCAEDDSTSIMKIPCEETNILKVPFEAILTKTLDGVTDAVSEALVVSKGLPDLKSVSDVLDNDQDAEAAQISHVQHRDTDLKNPEEMVDGTDNIVRVNKGETEATPYTLGVHCKICQEEVSTKAALRLHTCYSIMDKTITVDGNVNRKRVAPTVLDFGTTEPCKKKVKCVDHNSRKTSFSTKGKKPNSIMLMKAQFVENSTLPDMPRLHDLTLEEEHGDATKVVRWCGKVVVNYPILGQLQWIKDTEEGLHIKDCSVGLKRIDSENNLNVNQKKSRLEGLNNNEILDKSLSGDESSSIEVTLDDEVVDNLETCLGVSDKFQIPNETGDTFYAVESCRKMTEVNLEDGIKPIKNQVEESIKSIDSDPKNQDPSVKPINSFEKDNTVKTNKTENIAKKNNSFPVSVKTMVMKAIRKNNCLVRVKKLSSEDLKKWTLKKRLEGKASKFSRYRLAASDLKSRAHLKTVYEKLSGSKENRIKDELNDMNYLRQSGGFKIPKVVKKEKLDIKLQEEGSDRLQSHKRELKEFKIPRMTNTKSLSSHQLEARAKDYVREGGQVISVGGFLATEKIDTNVNIEQFAKEEAEFKTMFDNINLLKSNRSTKIYQTEDKMELEDLEDKNWEKMRKLGSDKERKKLAQKQFRNAVSSDPAINLSFHGYRRRGEARLLTGSFTMVSGNIKPLPGYKKKGEAVDVAESRDLNLEKCKKIKLEDFSKVMKSLFYKKYAKNLGLNKASQEEFDEFKSYLRHYKTGQDETRDFLSFYQKEVMLDIGQTYEVMDMENQYSTFFNYYGAAESTFCSVCDKKHKFCQ